VPGWGIFVSYLVARYNQTQADLVDQLFNSAEKRLARTLLLLARFGKEGRSENIIPKISQAPLAEMVGRPELELTSLRIGSDGWPSSTMQVGWKFAVLYSKSCCTSNVSLQDESGRRMCTIGQFLDS
jgi:hypothetical protein